MRKLLNTIYITNELAYLSLDGENLVCTVKDEIKFRIPFDNIENIVCFSYLGCSPAVMGKCVQNSTPINFMSPQGKFLAKVCGETKGNVFLRVAQIDVFRQHNIFLIQNTLASKFSNCIRTIFYVAPRTRCVSRNYLILIETSQRFCRTSHEVRE